MQDPLNPSPTDLELDHQLMEILSIHEKIFSEMDDGDTDWSLVGEWMERRGKEIDKLVSLDRPAGKSRTTSVLFDRFESEHRKLERLFSETLDRQRGELRDAGRRAEAEKGYRLSGDPDNSYY